MDIITGKHSIQAALDNSDRKIEKVVGTLEALKELNFDKNTIRSQVLAQHDVQEKAKMEYAEQDFQYSRVQGNLFALAEPLQSGQMKDLYESVESGKAEKILALDQITDIHNIAAILRTASFYGVTWVVIGKKKEWKFPPSFFRIASGAYEHLKLAPTASMTKFLSKLSSKNVEIIGLSEHGTETDLAPMEKSRCMVLGSEDSGISNAVSRQVEKTIALPSKGGIKSLNVSVAAAISMEKFF